MSEEKKRWFCWQAKAWGESVVTSVEADTRLEAARKFARIKRLPYGTRVAVVSPKDVERFEVGLQ